jgi:hypothetical protein
VRDQREGALGVELEGTLQSRKQSQQRFPQTGYGAGLVGDEITPAGKEELQLGEGQQSRSSTCVLPDFGEVLRYETDRNGAPNNRPLHFPSRCSLPYRACWHRQSLEHAQLA